MIKNQYNEIVKSQDSRRVFISTLNELAEKDNSICLVTCDVGFSYISNNEKFKVLNLGVTEFTSSIISSALALKSFSTWFYTMIPFIAFRCHEQIRNAICLHKSPVKLAGVLGGPSYKMLGPSHNLLFPNEDVEVMKTLPNMEIYLPKTNEDVKQAVIAAYKNGKPSYLKLP